MSGAFHRRVPSAVLHQRQQVLCALYIMCERRTVFFVYRLVLRHRVQRTGKRIHAVAAHILRLRQQLMPPFGVRKAVKRRGVFVPIAAQYCARIRAALQYLKGIQHDLRHAAVIASGAEHIRQIFKFRAACIVQRFEYLLKHLCADCLLLTLVGGAEIRRKPQLVEMLAHQTHAPCVHGRDFCAVYQHQLAAQTCIFRVLRREAGQLIRDLAAHFRCRRLGKGHDQKAVDVFRVIRIRDASQDALDQYGGLARACRRRNQQCAAAVFNRSRLLLCPLYCHAYPSICSQNSC